MEEFCRWLEEVAFWQKKMLNSQYLAYEKVIEQLKKKGLWVE